MGETIAKRWQPVERVDGLWQTKVMARKGAWELRSAAIRLRDGELAVYSPSRGFDEAHYDELDALGRPTVVVAPNHYHHLGIPRFLERYPDAVVVASGTAAPRLRKQLAGPEPSSLGALLDRLPESTRVVEPPGTKAGEVWLVVSGDASAGADSERRPCGWVVCDAFFNLAEHPPGAFGLLCRATRTSKGLQIGNTFRWVGLRDRKAYLASLLAELERSPPTAMVVGHGEVLAGSDLAERLREVAERRL